MAVCLRALLLMAHICGCFAGLIGFAHVETAPTTPQIGEVLRYSFGPAANSAVPQPSDYAIEILDSTGAPTAASQKIKFADDALMPGCDAAFDATKNVLYKTTIRASTFLPAAGCGTCPSSSACCRDPATPGDEGTCYKVSDCSQISAGQGGDILTIDANSGRILRNVSMTGDVAPPTFGAYDASSGLMYSMVPYSYTEFGLFSYNPMKGDVEKVASWQKGQMDGIGVCDGLAFGDSKMVFMLGGKEAQLIVVDLKSQKIVNRVNGFYGPLVVDPLHPDRLLAIQNKHKRGLDLVWIDPMQNITTTVFSLNATTLGEDLRAQDQASMAVDPSGNTIWFIASYNNPKTGYLYRGIFTVQLAADRKSGTLQSERYAFGDANRKANWLGRLDYINDSSEITDLHI